MSGNCQVFDSLAIPIFVNLCVILFSTYRSKVSKTLTKEKKRKARMSLLIFKKNSHSVNFVN